MSTSGVQRFRRKPAEADMIRWDGTETARRAIAAHGGDPRFPQDWDEGALQIWVAGSRAWARLPLSDFAVIEPDGSGVYPLTAADHERLYEPAGGGGQCGGGNCTPDCTGTIQFVGHRLPSDSDPLDRRHRTAPGRPAMADEITFARPFILCRDTDVTGVSGTGVVADGTLWPDGSVSIRWRGDRPSTVFWQRLEDAVAVHGHGGTTRLVWERLGVPESRYSEAWTELHGFVTAAEADGGVISPADLRQYMDELKREALKPVREWMDRVRGTGEASDA